jgi:pimeloyl-ACP methyl ester carboxylesterase
MSAVADTPLASLTVNGIRIETVERGRGRPLLFLHPGFGGSEQPRSFNTIDDLAYFYLDLLEERDLKDVVVVGVSLGAWIAAEMAVKSTQRISRLVLANAVGIKVGDRETRDIVDIFAKTEKELNELAYFDPAVAARDYKAMAEADVRVVARNREATARYGWSPYLHDPKLKGRLHRIRVPTLFLWGAADRILSEGYGRAYCAAVPSARFEAIARAGHYPHIEQPDAFARAVSAFIEGSSQ